MNSKQFRNALTEIPEHNGKYVWDSPFGYCPVFWMDGDWYTIGWDKLPDNTVRYWR